MIARIADATANKLWCSHCQKATMRNRGPLFALSNIDWWECTTCKMVERYRNNNDSRAQARSNAEDRGTAKEEGIMSEGTLESLKQLREKQTKTDSKKRQPKATRETKATAEVKTETPQPKEQSAESKQMKTQTKEKTKQAPKHGERKATKKVVAKVERQAKAEKKSTNGQRASFFIFDHPATNVIRWMGKNDFSYDETMAAFKALKITKLPTEGTIRSQLHHGKAGTRGEPAKLTAEQIKKLRAVAKVKD